MSGEGKGKKRNKALTQRNWPLKVFAGHHRKVDAHHF
jgi:hypothetical protein